MGKTPHHTAVCRGSFYGKNEEDDDQHCQPPPPPNALSNISDATELIGQRVSKFFNVDNCDKIYQGTVTEYDPKSRFWRIIYDDTDTEQMNYDELVDALALHKMHHKDTGTGKKKKLSDSGSDAVNNIATTRTNATFTLFNDKTTQNITNLSVKSCLTGSVIDTRLNQEVGRGNNNNNIGEDDSSISSHDDSVSNEDAAGSNKQQPVWDTPAPPSLTEQKKKEKVLMLIKVLMKYLEQHDAAMHIKAKAAIKYCYEKNKLDRAGLTSSMKIHLRATVGEQYWKKAHDYLRLGRVRVRGRVIKRAQKKKEKEAVATTELAQIRRAKVKKSSAAKSKTLLVTKKSSTTKSKPFMSIKKMSVRLPQGEGHSRGTSTANLKISPASTTKKSNLQKQASATTAKKPLANIPVLLTGVLAYSDENSLRRHIFQGHWNIENGCTLQRFELSRAVPPEEELKELPKDGEFNGSFNVQKEEIYMATGEVELKNCAVVENGVTLSFKPKQKTEGVFIVQGSGKNEYGEFKLSGTATRITDAIDPKYSVLVYKKYSATDYKEKTQIDKPTLPPILLPSDGVCLRGKLVRNSYSCFSTPEELSLDNCIVHSITGMWSLKGLTNILEDPEKCEKFEYEHKCFSHESKQSTVFPLSGKYIGFYHVSDEVTERDVVKLKFLLNSEGYHNVEGTGENVCGRYKVTGTLDNDGTITLFHLFETDKKRARKEAVVDATNESKRMKLGQLKSPPESLIPNQNQQKIAIAAPNHQQVSANDTSAANNETAQPFLANDFRGQVTANDTSATNNNNESALQEDQGPPAHTQQTQRVNVPSNHFALPILSNTIKGEDTDEDDDDEDDDGHLHFQVFFSGKGTNNYINVRRERGNDLKFCDLRHKIEEDVKVPWDSFCFTLAAKSPVCVNLTQETKWKVHDNGRLTKIGNGSLRKPYRVFIKESS